MLPMCDRASFGFCSQRIWNKHDYMLKMHALIYYYLDYLKINTYKGAIDKEGSTTYYNLGGCTVYYV